MMVCAAGCKGLPPLTAAGPPHLVQGCIALASRMHNTLLCAGLVNCLAAGLKEPRWRRGQRECTDRTARNACIRQRILYGMLHPVHAKHA